jgi:DNA-binding transcriptional LysR family regulator
MNTRDIEAFVAVVETGSIVAASARLHLTQPGVTRRIQNLEQTLGTELLFRQSKPLRPTPAGREAYELGRRVLRSVSDLVDSMAPEGELSGEFRVGITPFLAEVAFGEPLDRLRAAFPKLALRLSTGWSPALMPQVDQSGVDVVALFLAEGTEPPPHLVCEPLGSERAIVVAARDAALPKRATLRDLAEHAWILNPGGCGVRNAVRHAFESTRLPFEVAGEALGPDLQLSLVARGLGIALATRAVLAASPYRDTLREVEVADFKPMLHAWLVHRPPAGRLAAPIALLRDSLVESLRRKVQPSRGARRAS